MTRPPAEMGAFREVEHWVFDLDNTLYPAESRLFAQIDERIGAFVARLLSIPADAARTLQKDYYRRYGTTLRGLMIEHGITADEFLSYVHDIDHSPLAPAPRLAQALSRLPGKRFIMTNGSRGHAVAVAAKLGIGEHFEDIFDIVDADHVPKPDLGAYSTFWQRHGIEPTRAAMFEDLARNLAVPHAHGMRTVLVVPSGTREVFREAWELDGRDEAHVEHVTDDLAAFLEAVLAALGGEGDNPPGNGLR